MFYYQIALPLAVDINYTYSSKTALKKGSRVVVKFIGRHYTGIVWQQTTSIDPKIKYLPLEEVIDKQPLIPEEILDLAQWVSSYYLTPLGMCLFAMLPNAMDVVIQLECRLGNNNHTADLSSKQLKIINLLKTELWTPLATLKKEFKGSGFYYLLENLESNKFIEIKRTFDKKIKKKIANYVVKNDVQEIPSLTTKQQQLYDLICSHKEAMPLKIIASDFSYAIVKALRTKKLISVEPREVQIVESLLPEKRTQKQIEPSDEQVTAISALVNALEMAKFSPFLLYGITGSGKTEVYIRVIHKALKMGKTALMLVPEIALTPQMVERFFNAFGENIAILHSHLNDRQRWQQWQNIRSGTSRIVIGARSAVFAPLKNIGVIIVDEEHENSYKQDSTPRYNGRDLAVMRAYKQNAVVVLGSATPSLESWYNVIENKYQLLKLTRRPSPFQLPKVNVVNMQNSDEKNKVFSQELLDKIEDRLNKKQQVILFQNRRGHSSFIQCVQCGKLIKCPDCEISMNYHSFNDNLLCHYCGLVKPVPRRCPDCGSFIFNFGSPGTQQIEEQLKIIFPQAKILRMDSDTTSKAQSYQTMFDRMKEGSVDILLGTQMISKGLDFPNVTLVGVISADVGLSFPDFRAGEDTFQLLTQVAGRSGRGDIEGEVIIQTYNPSHYAVTTATRQDFEAFAQIELDNRKILHYAPFYRLARLIFSAEKPQYIADVLKRYQTLFDYVTNCFDKEELIMIGPAPAPLARIKKKSRYHIFIKGKNNQVINSAVSLLKDNLKLPSAITLTIDIDPYNMM